MTKQIIRDSMEDLRSSIRQYKRLMLPLREYFGTNTGLKNYIMKENFLGHELISLDGSYGFSFTYLLPNGKNIPERRNEERMKKCRCEGKRIVRKFCDYEHEIAGFCWREH